MTTAITETGIDHEEAITGSANCLPIGTRVAEFEITGIVGEGGFGIVYLALDHSLQRTVALKEYMPGVMAGRGSDQSVVVRSKRHQPAFDTGLRSFINEARLLAQFDHPALIKIHRFWEQNNTGYMAMRFYEGQTLKRILEDSPDFVSEAWLKVILQSILEALEALYKVQILHRDISPENIMIQKNGAAVLLDFGAARQIISDMTQSLTVILKPGYAPIEQYADDPSMLQGPWTDLYSLAAVMYVSIARKSPPSSVARMIKDPIDILAKGNYPGYSHAFLAAIDQALSVRPEHRPRSIAAFRALLGIEGHDAPPQAARSRIEQASEKKAAEKTVSSSPPLRDKVRPTMAPAVDPVRAPVRDILDPETQMMTQPMTAAVMDAATPGMQATPTPATTDRPPAAGRAASVIAAAAGKRRLLLIASAAVLLVGTVVGVRSLREPDATDPGAAPAVTSTVPARSGTEQMVDEETLAWETLNQQSDPNAGQVTGFIARYPNGRMIDRARARLDQINRRSTAAAVPGGPSAQAGGATANAAPPLAAGAVQNPAPSGPTVPGAAAADGASTSAIAPVEVATGTLSLSIKPWGTVSVDGVAKGVSPPMKRLQLSEGRHQIKVVNPNFPERMTEIEVVKKKTASLVIDFAT